VSEEALIESSTVATFGIDCQRSNNLARSHPTTNIRPLTPTALSFKENQSFGMKTSLCNVIIYM
jgi:hypothetical protein